MNLEELEAKIEPYWAERPVWRPVWRAVDTGEGWYDLISDLMDQLTAVSTNFKILQIKEKFGGLRFYIDARGVDEELRPTLFTLIGKAEDLSLWTCEVCGEDAEVTDSPSGWMRTLCERHAR